MISIHVQVAPTFIKSRHDHMISDTRLPPAFCAFISGGRREPGDEVRDFQCLNSHIHPQTPAHLHTHACTTAHTCTHVPWYHTVTVFLVCHMYNVDAPRVLNAHTANSTGRRSTTHAKSRLGKQNTLVSFPDLESD